MLIRLATVSSLALGIAAPALAAGPEQTATQPDVMVAAPAPAKPKLMFTLRGGVASNPEYFGSDENAIGADLGFSFNYLSLRNGRTFGNPDPWADSMGLTFGGSFRFIEERKTDDFNELAGLNDIDAAAELGVSMRYGTEHFAAFGEVRRGFGGHEGWVGEVGADAILRPTDRLRLSMGPRLFFGDDAYSDTYFGITAAESSAALPAYDPDGGMVSAGVEFGARYQINDVWGLEGAVTWEKFTDDAADSPIVQQGSDEQWGVRFGVTRVFSIGG
ncbi:MULTISPECIES: MipA/OmpV family protein [Marivita]|uniref:MipA/OmpV family protein n=2 Tax=Marivita cryptomonadis TaxID=505252 RepID=A0A9Q2NRR2_9RHOB|nr:MULTISPECIES: MipA/OmpV family protein [Marivita]MBM2321485.1 MipA/OmpV family protein [Marivita cryptomonadis]MBM2331066.1 MipA/OmpV family protein [Marivita cryptomonadis]MBM2340652.1 MipA/OmpV family protein [Marivita cryptomonadis]MBM2345314.1 MipA/OmpV family protein [Marivita cryptomonadis]MBM2349992.1 MipA/OmpV family protein [Marivita cryptomonadis]